MPGTERQRIHKKSIGRVANTDTIREREEPRVVLDKLFSWLNRAPKSVGHSLTEIASTSASWISELGLPANSKNRNVRDFAILLLRAGAEMEIR